jgi:hypothetical protein
MGPDQQIPKKDEVCNHSTLSIISLRGTKYLKKIRKAQQKNS